MAVLFYADNTSEATMGNLFITKKLLVPFFLIIGWSFNSDIVDQGLIFLIVHARIELKIYNSIILLLPDLY